MKVVAEIDEANAFEALCRALDMHKWFFQSGDCFVEERLNAFGKPYAIVQSCENGIGPFSDISYGKEMTDRDVIELYCALKLVKEKLNEKDGVCIYKSAFDK